MNKQIVNIASVPHRSVFRYPGGKTWFVPRLREWLKSQKKRPQLLIEPFVGGGIISLTAVSEGLVEKALMIEIDDDVASVWKVIVSGESEKLAEQILNFQMNYENVVSELQQDTSLIHERAFQTILKNRCFHGGIMAKGSGLLKKGEAGKGVMSRWYPETLARRLRDINAIHKSLEFRQTDAFNVLDEYQKNNNVVFFIDPPYTVGGKKAGSRLYKHHELDHELLFEKCSHLTGDFIMTYDNAEEVKALAEKYNFQYKQIAMKNTHHAKMTELVIGRNLDWLEETEIVLKRKEKKYKTHQLPLD